MEKKSSKKIVLIACAIFLALAAIFASVYFLTKEKPVEGQKTISIVIVKSDDDEKTVSITTQAEYLYDALKQENLIEGEESAYGFFITAVDGRKADSSKDEWWCITKGTEQVNTGVSATVITNGDTFELTLKTGW